MTNVFKVAKPGHDALTANPKDLIFDSTLNHLKNKVADSFTETVSNGGTYVETIAHGISGHPLCMAYFSDNSNPSKWYVVKANFGVGLGRQLSPVEVEIYTDGTNAYIKIYNNSGSEKTINVQYEIFYESA